MTNIIVVARADGRGGCKPFGSYSSKQAGAMVTIGEKSYKVTSDGRINIPKAVMNNYGRTGDDGRKRIEIQFSTKGGVGDDYWKNVKAQVGKPVSEYKNAKTGDKVKKLTEERKEVLAPLEGESYEWGT